MAAWVKLRRRQKVEGENKSWPALLRENENKILTNILRTRKTNKSKLVASKWGNIRNCRNSVLEQQEHFLSYQAQPPALIL